MSIRRASGLVALAAVCVAVAGCGGGHSKVLSRRQLVRRAQTICLRAQTEAGAMLPPSHQAGLAGMASYLQKSASIAEAKTEALKALKVRLKVAKQWHRLIAAEEAFTARQQSLGQAAVSGDARRVGLMEADTGPEQDLIRRARKFGASLCAP